MTERPLVFVIADYGAGDMAFAEVHKQIFLRVDADVSQVNVPSYSTTSTGFCIYQLSLNDVTGGRNAKTYIFSNTAPRRDNSGPRKGNAGEGLVYARLKNGIEILAVLSGETLSFVKPLIVELRSVKVSNAGSQFRSRDNYPVALAKIMEGDHSILGEAIDIGKIADPRKGRIAYVDGYGNIKLTSRASELPELKFGDEVAVTIGDKSSVGTYSAGMFDALPKTLCVAPGSAGPADDRFLQISIRMGNAWEALGRPPLEAEVRISKGSYKLSRQ